MAMANSLEIRLPYLDYRIIEFMAKVPPTWKILGLNEKHILKKSFKPYLPKSITTRTKHPYRAPIQQSLFGDSSPEYLKDLLSETNLRDTGLFNENKVSLLLKKVQAGKSTSEVDGMALAGILSTMLIHYQFISNFSPAAPKNIKFNICVDKRNA